MRKVWRWVVDVHRPMLDWKEWVCPLSMVAFIVMSVAFAPDSFSDGMKLLYIVGGALAGWLAGGILLYMVNIRQLRAWDRQHKRDLADAARRGISVGEVQLERARREQEVA